MREMQGQGKQSQITTRSAEKLTGTSSSDIISQLHSTQTDEAYRSSLSTPRLHPGGSNCRHRDDDDNEHQFEVNNGRLSLVDVVVRENKHNKLSPSHVILCLTYILQTMQSNDDDLFSISTLLGTAGVPNVLWGDYLLIVYGVPTYIYLASVRHQNLPVLGVSEQ